MKPKIDAVDYWPTDFWDDWDSSWMWLNVFRHEPRQQGCPHSNPTRASIQRMYHVCKQHDGEFWEYDSGEWHWRGPSNIYD